MCDDFFNELGDTTFRGKMRIKFELLQSGIYWAVMLRISRLIEWLAPVPPFDVSGDDELESHTHRLFLRHSKIGEITWLPVCPLCFHIGPTAWRRRNTAYVDDKLNWLLSCQACYDEDYANFQELWDDYYTSRW